MENRPLDYTEPESLSVAESPERKRNKKLTFYLEIIPLTLLGLGVLLQYLEQPSWRVVFASGAILACLVYILSSWWLLWRRRYGLLERILSAFGFLFFILAGYAIYQHFFNLEQAYFFRMYTRIFGMIILGVACIGFVYRIGDPYFSDYYRRLLTRLLVLIAILFKGLL